MTLNIFYNKTPTICIYRSENLTSNFDLLCNVYINALLVVKSLLMKIRELLLTLSDKELLTLERMLCSSDEVKFDEKLSIKNQQLS